MVQLKVDLADDIIQSQYPHYLKGGRLSVGGVEVCIGGRYGTICEDYLDYQDASVVCSLCELGGIKHKYKTSIY